MSPILSSIHTNGIENVWSLLKRAVTGTYHKLSVKHLDAYLDELEWRFNNRGNPYLFRDTLLKLLNAKNLGEDLGSGLSIDLLRVRNKNAEGAGIFSIPSFEGFSDNPPSRGDPMLSSPS